MKPFFYIITILITSLVNAQFSENFGTGRSRVLFYANSSYGFQNDLYDTSTACYVVGPTSTEMSTSGGSTTLPFIISNTPGASGGGAIELRNYVLGGTNSTFIIDNINTLQSTSISLNIRLNMTTSTLPLNVSYWNGTTYVSINQLSAIFTGLIVGYWKNISFVLPAGAKQANLKLRIFARSAASPGSSATTHLYIDDIKTDNTLSNDDFSLKNIKIYPNPAKNKFTINLGNEVYTNYEVKIFNLIGQEVYSSKIVNSIFEINNTWNGEGVYFVKILNSFDELVFTRKIIMLN